MDNKTCFIISSIGEKGSAIRKIADKKYDLIFEPILKNLQYEVTRADKVGSPGSISYDIVKRIIESDLIIADISDLNPNVFYELAIRNAVNKPVIVIKGLNQKMPFDIYDKRAISLDMNEARSWTKGKKDLENQIKEASNDKEVASQSILSDFVFPNYTERKITPETDMALQVKDVFMEIRQIRNELHEMKKNSRNTSLGFIREINDEWEEITDLREDDKEIAKFIKEKGGAVLESDLRKKFLQPRTTMWRVIKRMERVGLIDIEKKDLQNLIKLKKEYR